MAKKPVDVSTDELPESSWWQTLLQYGPMLLIFGVILFFAIRYIDPAPPRRVVIATGDGEGDYEAFAKEYHDFMQQEGVRVETRPTRGALENIDLLLDPKSDVSVAFVQDGLVTGEKASSLVSLGSLYYEPLWIFYSDLFPGLKKQKLTRLSDLKGRRISVGEAGSGTSVLAMRLLAASGVTEKNSRIEHRSWQEAEPLLRSGSLDASLMIAPPEDPLIENLLEDPALHLLSLDQAEAVARQLPFLHHLVLPHGAISLEKNLPPSDVDLVAPTATLLAKENLHPAVVFLLLKAATQIHGDPGIFEAKNEFPSDKDYEVSLSPDARHFYKTGMPFWQRYMPFWLATIIERLLIIAVPFFAVVLPALRSIPKAIQWRSRKKIMARYGELKYLETQIRSEKSHAKYPEHLKKLGRIEEKVNALRLPIDFTEHIYGLRGHIQFVREHLKRDLNLP